MRKKMACAAVILIACLSAVYGYAAEHSFEIQIGNLVHVAEKEERLTASIVSDAEAEEEISCYYAITDYDGRHVQGGTGVIPVGANSCMVSVGSLDVGWYTMTVNCLGDTFSEDFAVVYPKAERISYTDTPFAADFAGQGIVSDPELLAAYSQAVKLAGVDWVRERFYWAQTEPAQNQFDFSRFDQSINIISSAGLKILNMVPDYPSWLTGGGILPGNLLHVYQAFQEFAKRYDGKVFGWEIGNEADLKTVSPDAYASVVKAALAGVESSGADAFKLFGGFAFSPQISDFAALCMQNDLLSYCDCYNLHTHRTDTGESPQEIQYPVLQAHRQVAFQYKKTDVPFWVTEAGLYMDVSGSPEQKMTLEQKKRQAEYVVTSTVRSLAEGTDKHFWFIIPSYIEAGRELGVFSSDNTPNPAYCAESTMTYLLGKGTYLGEFASLPLGVQGYLFDRGGGDTAVLWSETDTYIQLRTDQPVVRADLMGRQTRMQPLNGYVRVKVGTEPIYILFEGQCPDINFYPERTNSAEIEKTRYAPEEKVIIAVYFEETNSDISHRDGFPVEAGEDKEVKVYVYNFNETEISGTLTVPEGTAFTAVFEDTQVNVPAFSRRMIRGMVRSKADAVPGQQESMVFQVQLSGGGITSAAAPLLVVKDTEPVEETVRFAGAQHADGWDLSGAAAGTVSDCVDTGQGVCFTADFTNAAAKWFYPGFYVDETLNQENATGIMFSAEAEEDYPNTDMNVFCYLSDGRVYFAGNAADMPLRRESRTFYLGWDAMVLYDSPLGVWADTRPFDPALVTRIAIGCTAGVNSVVYTITKAGCYYQKSAVSPVQEPIVLPSDTEIYRTETFPVWKVQIAQELRVSAAEVYINGQLYQSCGAGTHFISVSPVLHTGKEKVRINVWVRTADGRTYAKENCYRINDFYYW